MIRSYFNAEAESIKLNTGPDGYGDAELSEIATGVSCRKMKIDELKKDNKGKEVISTVEVWLPGGIQRLTTESEIVFEGESFKVISSQFVSGLISESFQKVFLK
jgi:hypothetical protein